MSERALHANAGTMARASSLVMLVMLAASPVQAQRNESWVIEPKGDSTCLGMKRGDVVSIHHDTRTVVLCRSGAARPDTIESESELRVRRGVFVQVAHTNSALYSCSVTSEKVTVPELDSLRAFLFAASGFLPIFLGSLAPDRTLPARGTEKGRLTRADTLLDSLAYAFRGSDGLIVTRAEALKALDSMTAEDAGVERLANRFFYALQTPTTDRHGPRLTCTNGRCGRLRDVTVLLGILRELPSAVVPVPNESYTADMEANNEKIASIMEHADDLVAYAYGVDALARRTAQARPTLPCDSVTVRGNSGRSMTIAIAPRGSPEMARLTTRDPLTIKLKVLPSLLIRPAVGLSLLKVRRARYAKWGTEPTRIADSVRVIKAGMTDDRFGYGLTLGLAPRWLDWRDGSGWAVWPLEVIVTPTNDLKTFGVGGGVSWKLLRISAGAIWTKHSVLVKQTLGQVLRDSSSLSTSDGYGHPKLYTSFSIVGWPPFLRTGS